MLALVERHAEDPHSFARRGSSVKEKGMAEGLVEAKNGAPVGEDALAFAAGAAGEAGAAQPAAGAPARKRSPKVVALEALKKAEEAARPYLTMLQRDAALSRSVKFHVDKVFRIGRRNTKIPQDLEIGAF